MTQKRLLERETRILGLEERVHELETQLNSADDQLSDAAARIKTLQSVSKRTTSRGPKKKAKKRRL